MKRILLALAASLILASPAHAAFTSSTKLNTWIEASDRIANGNPKNDDFAMAANLHGYIWGIYDAFDGVLLCAPDTATTAQMKAIVRQYLQAHPERWNEPARSLVFAALQPAFPCKK